MAKVTRKPRKIVSKNPAYPVIQVTEEGRIWFQNTPRGQWNKVPPGRAKDLHVRLSKAIKYAVTVRRHAH
jgi:hypothetical protein